MGSNARFSPYNIGAHFAKATGLDKVFRGRVTKPQASLAVNRHKSPLFAQARLEPATSSGAVVKPPAVDEDENEDEDEDEDEVDIIRNVADDRESFVDGTPETEYEDDLTEGSVYESIENGAVIVERVYESDLDELASSSPRVDDTGSTHLISAQKSPRQPYADETSEDELMAVEEDVNPFARLVPRGEDSGSDVELSNPDEDLSDEALSDEALEAVTDWEVDEETQREYEETKQGVEGHEQWGPDLSSLHKLLSLRGRHPLMPFEWANDLVDMPILPELFAPLGTQKSVIIRALSNQFRATKALRGLFELQGRVSAYRQAGVGAKIAKTIEKEIKRYMGWARKDAGLDCHEYRQNILIVRFDRLTMDAETLGRTVEEGFVDWAKSYRRYYKKRGIRRYPRILYGFVIVQHTVTIMTVDCSDSDPKPLAFAEVNLSRQNHWLDSGLGIAITIHMARERLLQCQEDLPTVEVEHSDDPDA